MEFPQPDNSEDHYAGFKALWSKVLIRALYDRVMHSDSTRKDKRKWAETAQEWLFHSDSKFTGFENVCASLNLDPDRVRRHAQQMKREDVAKIEHLERSSTDAKKRPKVVEDRPLLLNSATFWAHLW